MNERVSQRTNQGPIYRSICNVSALKLLSSVPLPSLQVNATFCLLRAVCIGKPTKPPASLSSILEPVPSVYGQGRVHVANRGIALVVEGMIRSAKLVNVRPAVLKCPVGQDIDLMVVKVATQRAEEKEKDCPLSIHGLC